MTKDGNGLTLHFDPILIDGVIKKVCKAFKHDVCYLLILGVNNIFIVVVVIYPQMRIKGIQLIFGFT